MQDRVTTVKAKKFSQFQYDALHSEHPEMLIKSWQLQVVAIGWYVFQSWGNFGCFRKNGQKIIPKMLLSRQAEETRFKNSSPG